MISASRQPLVLRDDTIILKNLRQRFVDGTQPYKPSAKNTLLTFLAMCNNSDVHEHSEATQSDLERKNATGEITDDRVLLSMCKGVLQSSDLDAAELEYLASYHFSCFVRNRFRCSQPRVDRRNANLAGTWLSWDSVKRCLVIPDVRKLALDLQWKRELRPGEREYVRRCTANVTSSDYGVLQTLRTSEYLSRIRMGVMYGDINHLHKHGWLDTIVLAIVQTRMQSRTGLDWLSRCVQFSAKALERKDQQAHMLVERECIVVSDGNVSHVCSHATAAYQHWCKLTNTIIDGRYNISQCTI